MGSFFENIKRTKIWQTAIVYLGGAWVVIEALDFVTRKYGFSGKLIDVTVLLVILGLPFLFANNYFRFNQVGKHPKTKELSIYSILMVIAISGIYYIYAKSPGIKYNINVSGNAIAVLTFDNFSVEQDNQYLAAGVAEAIRNNLGQVGNLKVISRNSIEQFQKLDLTTPQIGEKLGVKYVLDGSIQKFKEKIKINIELLDSEEDIQIWAKSYEKNYDDLLTIQNNIAEDVANKLSLTVNINQSPVKEVKNIEAYELYLEGMELVRRPKGSRDELKNALQIFDKVLEMDPGFAHAYVGKARAYINDVSFGRSSLNAVKDETIALIMKAMELNNGISESYSSLGLLYYQLLDLEKATEYFNKAIELNPNNIEAYIGLGEIHYLNDDLDGFNKFYDYAISLDPLIIKYKVDKLGLLYFVTKEDQLITELENISIETNSDYATWSLGMMYALAKQYDKAIQTFLSRKIKGADTNWALGYVYGLNGESERAKRILDSILKRKEEAYVPPFMISVIYIGLGEYDLAMDWLEKEYEEASFFIIYALKADPKFDPLVNSPRFKAMLAKMPFKRV